MTRVFVTPAQKTAIGTAVQPGDLGTAAAADVGDFATAAQGTDKRDPNDHTHAGTGTGGAGGVTTATGGG